MSKVIEFMEIDWNTIVKPLLDHPLLGMTHYADDDAMYQAFMFLQLKKLLVTRSQHPFSSISFKESLGL